MLVCTSGSSVGSPVDTGVHKWLQRGSSVGNHVDTGVHKWLLCGSSVGRPVDSGVHKWLQPGSSVGSPVDTGVYKWLQHGSSVSSPVDTGVHKWLQPGSSVDSHVYTGVHKPLPSLSCSLSDHCTAWGLSFLLYHPFAIPPPSQTFTLLTWTSFCGNGGQGVGVDQTFTFHSLFQNCCSRRLPSPLCRGALFFFFLARKEVCLVTLLLTFWSCC